MGRMISMSDVINANALCEQTLSLETLYRLAPKIPFEEYTVRILNEVVSFPFLNIKE